MGAHLHVEKLKDATLWLRQQKEQEQQQLYLTVILCQLNYIVV